MNRDSVNNFLRKEIKPKLAANEQLKEVIVWAIEADERKGLVKLGLALGGAAGCSPFCGCAAQQVADQIKKHLIQKWPAISRVIGVASLPSPEWEKEWKN